MFPIVEILMCRIRSLSGSILVAKGAWEKKACFGAIGRIDKFNIVLVWRKYVGVTMQSIRGVLDQRGLQVYSKQQL